MSCVPLEECLQDRSRINFHLIRIIQQEVEKDEGQDHNALRKGR